ncbi:hypothetical protein [Candidatus Palauibacter sp.]|uniref:hypothetical protein n=1 Tax=Candidatus Palauibacter sp. TaxID=3101350 RepID=UPI003AF30E9D
MVTESDTEARRVVREWLERRAAERGGTVEEVFADPDISAEDLMTTIVAAALRGERGAARWLKERCGLVVRARRRE